MSAACLFNDDKLTILLVLITAKSRHQFAFVERKLCMMSFFTFLSWLATGFAGGVVISSFFEWTLHRYVMHRPVGSFTYPFRAHALVHHHIFKSDHTYHVINPADKKIIPMAWWNGP